MSAGFLFPPAKREWLHVQRSPAAQSTYKLERPIRMATLNCLHDHAQAELLQHAKRHDAICRELRALDADVIGLNEVTRPLLERVLQEPWVRESFTVSVLGDDERCAKQGATTSAAFGNVLLSKIPPASVEYIEQPGDGRHSHVMSLSITRGGAPLRMTVCSTHLTAFPWLMEGRRRRQVEDLTSALTSAGNDACVVMGDFNFHREAENASIPDGWSEVPAVVALGPTWDFGRNPMLAHYLPLRNIYNGFGLGADSSLAWPSPMRLDRVLVHGTALDCGAAKARIFADQPVDERARGRAPLPQAGRELSEAHRALPWQEYLFPSDHFGLCFEL